MKKEIIVTLIIGGIQNKTTMYDYQLMVIFFAIGILFIFCAGRIVFILCKGDGNEGLPQ